MNLRGKVKSWSKTPLKQERVKTCAAHMEDMVNVSHTGLTPNGSVHICLCVSKSLHECIIFPGMQMQKGLLGLNKAVSSHNTLIYQLC